MDLYICDFMKNTDCEYRGSKCAIFGGIAPARVKRSAGWRMRTSKDSLQRIS